MRISNLVALKHFYHFKSFDPETDGVDHFKSFDP